MIFLFLFLLSGKYIVESRTLFQPAFLEEEEGERSGSLQSRLQGFFVFRAPLEEEEEEEEEGLSIFFFPKLLSHPATGAVEKEEDSRLLSPPPPKKKSS